MKTFSLSHESDFEGWRQGARSALLAGIPPGDVGWVTGDAQPGLFGVSEDPASGKGLNEPPSTASSAPLTVPKRFLALCREMLAHAARHRFELAYRLLWRMQHERNLLAMATDRDVDLATRMAKEVRRDIHKMKAFVRFRKTGESAAGVEQFVAWFEPNHHTVRLAAPFFAGRFANMHWSILTPDTCAHWDGTMVSFSGGIGSASKPGADDLEDYWRTYYASIFNPARLKVAAMQSEMPKKYWHNLPEADLIPELIRKAHEQSATMIDAPPSVPNPALMRHRQAPAVQSGNARASIKDLTGLQAALSHCRDCPLTAPATQVVLGEGPPDSALMLVGEQPGDQEDLAGRPFVGPAGKLLEELLAAAEIDRASIYLTNAVKHFKYEPQGKRRVHKTPSAREIDHCRWWLQKEIELVAPRVIVGLGATALRSIAGPGRKLADLRGRPLVLAGGAKLVATYHPSFVLRETGRAAREARADIIDDLKFAAALLPATVTQTSSGGA